mmetsp:Transcript_3423/g.9842  ORF Transcript_3423/g.9842 Transcript_3423/m.9842 type:complete len:418 (+) Transcript_3423:197-1450(+)
MPWFVLALVCVFLGDKVTAFSGAGLAHGGAKPHTSHAHPYNVGLPYPWHHEMPLELLSQCREAAEFPSISEFPMASYTRELEPSQLLLTKESAGFAAQERRHADYWQLLSKYLEPRSIVGSWDTSSCAIVGNSGNLLRTEYGRDIDRHGVVVRMNRAKTKGFRVHAGHKTTVRMLNRYQSEFYSRGARRSSSSSPPSWKELPMEKDVTLVVSRLKKDGLLSVLRNITQLRHKFGREDVRVSFLSERVIEDAQALIDDVQSCASLRSLGTSQHNHASPSSGLAMLLWATRVCASVTAYGMGYPPVKEGKTPYQYHQFRSKGNKVHDFSVESHIIHSLAREGLITLCGPSGACCGRELPFKTSTPQEPPGGNRMNKGLDAGHAMGGNAWNPGRDQYQRVEEAHVAKAPRGYAAELPDML